ncbi:syntaxin 8 [Heterostelium album PN500]|uniref:Syntaxin 8 n=1 Tax=Heterostelium pallidum (strain ATCC 26659 / Pp 5 / PN500) TaxID=670386 RepID=D3BD69_HETP5|nr:syntaxin 8 [Heterostelium album PN500]EFA80861.1 syntaxin 8 [Heterostelium album PN500]|eukprot:XP_020432980.1 syntaxin 8 [Heterostelium album PN500]
MNNNNYSNNSNNSGFNRPNFNTPYLSQDAKSKLFEGGDGGGRKWGSPPQDTEYTRHFNNEQLLDKQKDVMADQDKLLDSLSNSIMRQKDIAITIGNEAEKQGIMLDDLNDHVDGTSTKIRNASRGILRLTKDSKTTGHWICICVLILVLIVVIALAAST